MSTHDRISQLAQETQAAGHTTPALSDRAGRAIAAGGHHLGPEMGRALSQRWERERAPTAQEEMDAAAEPLRALGRAVHLGLLAQRRQEGEAFGALWTVLDEASGCSGPDWDTAEHLTREGVWS